MSRIILCKDCGGIKSRKGNYCKPCGYKHRTRPSGLTYVLRKENPTSFKKGQEPWNKGTSAPYLDKSTGYLRIKKAGEELKHHRYVVELVLGRKLLPTELIHHIDHNKQNNNISNLRIMTRSEHMKLHWEERRANV